MIIQPKPDFRAYEPICHLTGPCGEAWQENYPERFDAEGVGDKAERDKVLASMPASWVVRTAQFHGSSNQFCVKLIDFALGNLTRKRPESQYGIAIGILPPSEMIDAELVARGCGSHELTLSIDRQGGHAGFSCCYEGEVNAVSVDEAKAKAKDAIEAILRGDLQLGFGNEDGWVARFGPDLSMVAMIAVVGEAPDEPSADPDVKHVADCDPLEHIAGPMGDAWRMDADQIVAQDQSMNQQHTTVAAWIVEARGYHPVWKCYTVGVYSLRDSDGQPNAKIVRPNATHEIALVALHPSTDARKTARSGAFVSLDPVNFIGQIVCASDEEAAQVCRDAVRDIVNNVINPEVVPQWIDRFGDWMVVRK